MRRESNMTENKKLAPRGKVGISLTDLIAPDGVKNPAAQRARKNFWEYCKYKDGRFFKENRGHLREICDALQALYEGKLRAPDGSVCRRLAISEPPRHGKSYVMSLFNQWMLGRNNGVRIISVSYNEILSARFARGVRDGIDETKIDPDRHIFSDVFPATRIKDGDSSAQLWSLEGQYFNFLAAGFGGTITGVGCNVLIVDDPIKNHMEAYNQRVLDEQWEYYTNTLQSRVEEGGMIVLIMTRWSTRDLVGRATEAEPGKWHVIAKPACMDEAKQQMLCPELMTYESYASKRRVMARDIFMANYQQQPLDMEGRLYQKFTTYAPDEAPRAGAGETVRITAYVDTADTGADYLCALIAAVKDGQAYVLDVIYTDAPMEKTEPMLAKALYDAGAQECVIESNNGGRGFARNVRRILWEKYRSRRTNVIDKNQRQNKQARILTEAPFVQNNILYPEDWAAKWPEYNSAMSTYQRKGRNEHDDAPDATTGLAETMQQGAAVRKRLYSGRGRRW